MTDKKYDVIVVGLGIMGVGALYQAAKRGARVLGIDRFSPPHTYGSSHGDTRITRQAIRVGSIAPGAVATELWGITDPAEVERLTYGERTFLRAEDVARAVVFMLSQPAHVTVRDLIMLPQNQDI